MTFGCRWGLVLVSMLLGGSTFLDPLDAPLYQVRGTTIVDGQRNGAFSAIAGTTGAFSSAVSMANLTIVGVAVTKTGNFPAAAGQVFATGTTTLWLPPAAQTPTGRLLFVWNVGSNTVTLAATGSDTVTVFGANNAQAGPRHSMLAICHSLSSWIVQVN
ncbi:hypothetical protein J7643_03815 [bacterium]|nr:hypothetical protein [bacterium]